MDFAAILSDMFPQVGGNIIQNYIDDIGNATEDEFSIISDMILNYIKENIPDELDNQNDVIVLRHNREETNSQNGNYSTSLNEVVPAMRIRRQASVPSMPVIPPRFDVSTHTGAVPKRPIRSKDNNNINGIGAKPKSNNHYSKMTLVRNTFPDFIEDNDTIDFVDNEKVTKENKIYENFLTMLPQADPMYLKEKAKFFESNPTESAEEFIWERIDKKDYPSIDEYYGKLDEINTKKAFTTNFNLQNFIKQFPNAPEYFASAENPFATDEQIMKEERNHLLNILLNKYRRQRVGDVEKIFRRYKYNAIKTCNQLDRSKEQLFEDRPFISEKFESTNLALLQLIAYIKHRSKIDAQINSEADRREFARAEACASNSFLSCACCYLDDLLPEDCATCIEGCIFCKVCVRTGAEHCLAEAKTQYKCLSDCGSTFTDGTLQSVLAPVTYQRLTQRRQMEEIAEAKIPGLETCPFCEYATIPAEEDKVFQCENIDCKKMSCRKCRHESHLPLRCNEIEYDEDVRIRTAIENKMSEAMLRFKCVRCQKPIIKMDGCNRITCPCGQNSCYVCKKAINGYEHFNHGGCQLWQNAEVTRQDILKQANQAKEELGINNDPEKLKFDPTANF